MERCARSKSRGMNKSPELSKRIGKRTRGPKMREGLSLAECKQKERTDRRHQVIITSK